MVFVSLVLYGEYHERSGKSLLIQEESGGKRKIQQGKSILRIYEKYHSKKG